MTEKKIRANWDKKISSDGFVIILSTISILGFIGIVSSALFNIEISGYIEALWIIILGFGLLIKTSFRKIKSIKKGLSTYNFPHLTNAFIGIVAIITGILGSPLFNIINPTFHAIRGILAIIAIIIIFVETWIIKKEFKQRTNTKKD
ncbi:hypothetical protein J4465_01945 [Candidatus Pacearchaeota archaeon]|nr:hypothetical protein [Candidatus Pacearchaeota archaeon]